MSDLAQHVVLLSHLAPQMVWTDPAHRDEHHQARAEGRAPRHWPHQVNSHVEAVRGHDEPGESITIHRPAPWRCSCGVDLALDYREAPSAWAAHAARATGLPAELLARHMLVDVVGLQSEARCRCGEAFRAIANPTDGDEAVALWAAHVGGLA